MTPTPQESERETYKDRAEEWLAWCETCNGRVPDGFAQEHAEKTGHHVTAQRFFSAQPIVRYLIPESTRA